MTSTNQANNGTLSFVSGQGPSSISRQAPEGVSEPYSEGTTGSIPSMPTPNVFSKTTSWGGYRHRCRRFSMTWGVSGAG